MNGISRFVMGLFNHIKVMGDDNFMLYIRNEVESMMSSTEFGDKAKIIQPTSGLQYKSIQLFLG